jgi:hypothetical protein
VPRRTSTLAESAWAAAQHRPMLNQLACQPLSRLPWPDSRRFAPRIAIGLISRSSVSVWLDHCNETLERMVGIHLDASLQIPAAVLIARNLRPVLKPRKNAAPGHVGPPAVRTLIPPIELRVRNIRRIRHDVKDFHFSPTEISCATAGLNKTEHFIRAVC